MSAPLKRVRKPSGIGVPPDCIIRLSKVEELTGIPAKDILPACKAGAIKAWHKVGHWHTTLNEVEVWKAQKQYSGFVYFIAVPSGYVKIGYAADPVKRLSRLQVSHYEPMTLLCAIPGNREHEKRLHCRFKAYHVRGEWFRYEQPLQEFVLDACDAPGYRIDWRRVR